MKIVVRMFAIARQLSGRETIELDLPAGATVGQARRALAEAAPELAPVLPHVLLAVDHDYVADEFVLLADSQVACIPPVSGG